MQYSRFIPKMLDEKLITKICTEIEAGFENLSIAETQAESQPAGYLFHYTTPEGFLGIVQSKEIWATNVLYLNDASELSDAREILRAELDSAPLNLLGSAATFSQSIPYYSETLPLDHFVVSFSEEGDLLSQWRGYGSQGTGFSIGFSASTFVAAAVREENKSRGSSILRRVKYDLDEKVHMIRKRLAIVRSVLEPHAEQLEPQLNAEFGQLIKIWNQIAASFHESLALMKHASFAEEREWRFVRTLWKPSVPTVEWPVKIRMIGVRMAPYLPISWPWPGTPVLNGVQGIKEVYCGPSANPELKENVARDLLIAQKCWKAQVFKSTVPLRA
jgi:hypothetical protein